MSELSSKIKEVTELDSITGHEHSVRNYPRSKITPLVGDVQTDGLGDIFGIKNFATENTSCIMVAVHMDEVGFMVSDIKADGTMRAIGIGGWNPLVLNSQRFTFYTRDSRAIPVVSGSVPPHSLHGANGSTILSEIDDIIFDIGFTNKAEAKSLGILLDDIIVSRSETTLTVSQKNVISKTWDNRFGVLMVTELFEDLKGRELDNTLIVDTDVQEEVDLRGAHVSAMRFQPELFLVVDCLSAGDIYGNQGKIGGGTLFHFYDPGHIMLKNMCDFLLTTAEEANIKYQYYTAKGGTDAGAARLRNGDIPSITIGVCAHYIHSHQSPYTMNDFLQAQTFLQAIVKKLNRSTADLVKKY